MDAKTRKVLAPGRRVDLPGFGTSAVVYPMGLLHLDKFQKELMTTANYVAAVQVKPGTTEEVALQYLRALSPFILGNLLKLVAECVVIENKDITVYELPHWYLPPLIEACVEENFGGEDKLGPWLGAVESLIKTATGKDVSISETLFKLSSRPVTDSKTSSAAPEAHTPTKDGASSNSSTGPSAPGASESGRA